MQDNSAAASGEFFTPPDPQVAIKKNKREEKAVLPSPQTSDDIERDLFQRFQEAFELPQTYIRERTAAVTLTEVDIMPQTMVRISANLFLY